MQESRRAVWAWAWYDWANSAYTTVVVTLFFPILFQDYWTVGMAGTEATFRLGWASGLAGLLVALSAPLLGAVADRAGAKRRFLIFFMLLGALATVLLAMVPAGSWLAAAALYVFATVGFMGANVFYDALLVAVARPERQHFVSALGFGVGYLGGGLIAAVSVVLALQPAAFGFADAGAAARFAFLLVAGWWVIFALPLLLFVREPAAKRPLSLAAVGDAFKDVVATVRRIRQLRPVALFLLAYWLYIDAVDTVVVMAVAYGRSLGFGMQELILAVLLVQFIGFPSAIVYGKLAQRFGAKRGIYFGLTVYVLVCIWASQLQFSWEFYGIAVLVGLVQGGVQALSRSFYARLIPPAEAGEFFGFYNMLGKSATLIGPPLFGWFGVAFGNQRYSMLALIILFIAGALVLSLVKEPLGNAGAGS
jgi:UMF1 family MFS transporter